jgi:hypothetical protein
MEICFWASSALDRGGRMKKPEGIEMKNLLRPIFEKYHVDAYVCGHEHSFAIYQATWIH